MATRGIAAVEPEQPARAAGGSGVYRWYVLFVLMLVYAFNYVDRQIITILAVHIKADLGISDAQFGLLFGTAFAVFYGLFGIPMARLADGWRRVSLLSASLTFWSGMTALSGFANSFVQLGAARIGVGVGEAGATPAAVSLIGDYFERGIRATVLSIYSIGVYVGAGAALMIGGPVVIGWAETFGPPSEAPLGLAGWQAAFLVAGIPGIVLALIVFLTVREPQRGIMDGRRDEDDPAPMRAALRELGTMFPPWSLLGLRAGAQAGPFGRNLVILAIAVIGGATIAVLTDRMLPAEQVSVVATFGAFDLTANHIQWIAMGLAFYALASWFQHVQQANPAARQFITASRTFRLVTLAGAGLAFTMNAVNGFIFVYASRFHDMGPEIGFRFGAMAIVFGAAGIAASGLLSDLSRKRSISGRLYYAALSTACLTAILFAQFTASSALVFTLCYAAATFFMPMWFAPLQATTQDLVPPKQRGLAFAVFSIGPNVLGLGLGPYAIGLISDATGDLRLALLAAASLGVASIICLLLAARTLPQDEAQTLRYIEGGTADGAA